MSKKTFGTILKIAGGVALAAVTFGVGSAIVAGLEAGLTLGAAIGAVSLTTFGAAVLAGGLIAINIGNALSKGRPRIDAQQDIAGRLNIRQDPNASRDVLIGTVATAGVLRYKNLIEGAGDKPDTLWLIVVLAGYPCDGLDSFIFNGQTITVNVDGTTGGVFAGKLFVYFRKGDETDHAFPALVDGVWNAKTRRGRGLCCAAIKVINDEVFKGKVEPVFVVRGAKLFDPRQDTAWGGSGTHDFADDTTFEHSNNPSEAKLTFLRGFYIDDSGANEVLIAGRGLKDKETTRFDFANWIASANTDEDQIPVVGGGNIDRYTADGIIQVSRPLIDIIKILDASQAGTTVFSGGKYRSYPGIYRAPVLTFGEADIIGVPKRLDIRKGHDSIVNVVRGSFASADDRFELRDYPRQKDAASITRVGEMQVELNLPFTTDHRMAQRIALISMRQANAQRSFTATFSHRALRLAPGGETVRIDYPHFDFVNEVMRLTTWALIPAEDRQGMPGLNVDMTLVQDLSSFYSWTAASDEQSIATPGQMPGAPGPGALTVQKINERRDAKTFLRFTGATENKAEIPDDAAWDLPASATRSIEFAFFLDALGTSRTILNKRQVSDGKGWGFNYIASGDKLRFRIDDGGTNFNMLSDASLEAGRWYQVALTRTAGGVHILYLDKIPQLATLTNNTDVSNAAPVRIGLNHTDSVPHEGRVQDIRIWSDVRTAAEIGQNALAVLIGDEAGLTGLWRCDEGDDIFIINRGSVAGKDGTIFDLNTKIFWGGPVGEGLATIGQTFDEFNEAHTYIKFDGSVNGSRLEVANNAAWNFGAAEAGTWECDVYVDALGVNQVVIAKNLGITNSWGVRIMSDGDFEVWTNDGTTRTLDHQIKIAAGEWTHLAFSRTSAGVITSYLNTVPSNSTITANGSLSNSGVLQFGARQATTEELTGRMRDIRRWSTERTHQQIIDNARKDLVGDEADLIGFWPFREGTKDIAFQLGSTSGGDADFITAGPQWSGAVGEGLATENTGALADLDTVSATEIDTDAVTTVKVVDAAISKISIGTNGSNIFVSSDDVWTDLVSISFTKDEADSDINVTGIARTTQPGTQSSGKIRLLRDAVEIKIRFIDWIVPVDRTDVLQEVDSPSAATYTYKLQMLRSPSGGASVSIVAGQATLELQELKK